MPVPAARAASVEIQVNGVPREVPAGASLHGLLGLLGMDGRRVAVAVNRAVVPKSALECQRLAPGDRVEILEAVGGG